MKEQVVGQTGQSEQIGYLHHDQSPSPCPAWR